jgi:ABC-2 type transport system ATP-binding protein
MISLTGIDKSFKKQKVFKGLNLNFYDGVVYHIKGPNGCGKSTLLKIISGVLAPDLGQVVINNNDITKTVSKIESIGVYLGDEQLIDFLSPIEYLKLSNPQIFNRTDSIFKEILGEKKLIRDLSKGNKSKVGILSALNESNKIIVLDEPFANLDDISIFSLINELERLNINLGVTIIFTSHIPIEINKLNITTVKI